MAHLKDSLHMYLKIPVFISLFASVLVSMNIYAEVTSSIQAEVGVRYFQNDNPVKDYRASGFIKAEGKAETKFNGIEFSGEVFASIDQHDNKRTYVDLRQASLGYDIGNVKISAGINTFFWGVSETINIVNTLNQIDFRESVDGKSKVGQAFVSLDMDVGSNTSQILFLPDFREVDYPERPGSGIPISDNSIYEDGAGNGDFAARSQWSLDESEFAFNYFHGTRRDPYLTFNPDFNALNPLYIKTEYLAFDGVYFIGDITLKAEMKGGQELDEAFYAHNMGLEYVNYPEISSLQSLTWIFEHLYDDRGLQAESFGQNDVFFGTKADFGAFGSSDLRVVVGVDLDYRSKNLDISLNHRISDYLKLKFRLIQFLDVSDEDPKLSLVQDEDFAELSFQYAF